MEVSSHHRSVRYLGSSSSTASSSSTKLRHSPAQSIMAWSSIKKSFSTFKPDEKYNKNIQKIAGDLRPSKSWAFPWDKLHDYTDSCIKKQRNLQIPDGLNDYLVELIRGCSYKDVAIAACADFLSPYVLKELLNAHQPVKGSSHGLRDYIEILLAINHYHLLVVDDAEAKRALKVLPLVAENLNDPARMMQPLAELFMQGVPITSILSEYLLALARQACATLSTRMQTFRATGEWYKAHREAPWLPGLIDREQFRNVSTANLSLHDLLDQYFPDWRCWAFWKPDQQTISIYHSHLQNRQHDRVAIRDLLALEGPDFSYEPKSSWREVLAAHGTELSLQVNSVKFDFRGERSNHVWCTLNELTKLLVQVCTKDTEFDDSRMRLLRRMCIGTPINEEGLHLLEAAYNTGQGSVISGVDEVVAAQREKRESKLPELMLLFSALSSNSSDDLRLLLGESVMASVLLRLEKMQGTLRAIIKVDRLWTLLDLKILEELHGFGKTCQKSHLMKEASSDIQILLGQWPAIEEVQEAYSIIHLAQNNTFGETKFLKDQVERYLLHRMADPWPFKPHTMGLIEALISLWRKTNDIDRRRLALVAAQPNSNPDIALREECIGWLPLLDDGFIRILKFVQDNQAINPGETCVTFARALVSQPEVVECWRFSLQQIMETRGDMLEKWALSTLNAESWINFIDDIAIIFPERIGQIQANGPIFLHPSLHEWARTLASNLDTLKRVEGREGMRSNAAMKCILRGGDSDLRINLDQIIGSLNLACEEAKWNTLAALLARLYEDGRNADLIRRAMFRISIANVAGVEACLHILESYEEVSLPVAETMLACWINNEDMMTVDILAIESIAAILGLDSQEISVPSLDSLEATDEYIEERYKALLSEALRLESLRVAFKARDPSGLAVILQDVGVEDSSQVDDMLLDLPPSLIDVVERISENEVEFQISLAKLTVLQRKALGSGTAQSLLVRFSPGIIGMPPSFCMHFDNEPKEIATDNGHSPCLILAGSSEPEEHSCHGRATLGVYQLSRLLSQHLSMKGFSTFQDVHTVLVSEITTLSTKCLVCAVPHAFNLRRPTICVDPKCAQAFKNSHIDVRVADIRQDPAVVDLILTMAYASASSANLALLPGCPVTDMVKLKRTLDSLPAISLLQHVDNMEIFLTSYASNGDEHHVQELMAWCLTSYRGFLVSATANLKIPSFPGAQQFLLANASPQLERDFANRMTANGGNTRVVFHGTTIDRLYAILSQGLKDLSGTALQRHGQAYGKGVYVSTEPNTAWGYASPGIKSWSRSNFTNHKVLLACELTGYWSPASGNIHVITDPSCLMVRYVLMMPNNASIPIANHVVPALSSVFASLRSGAL